MWYKKAKEDWDDSYSYDNSAPEMEEDADYLNEMDQMDQFETNPLPYDKKDKRQNKKKNDLAKSNGKHYYHASPVLFKPGDMITPQETTNFNMSIPGLIYLTNSPVPHSPIIHEKRRYSTTLEYDWGADGSRGRAKFKEDWDAEPEEIIKECQAVIAMGTPKSSKVFSNHLLQEPINTKSNKGKAKVEKGLKKLEGKNPWDVNFPTGSLFKRKLK